MRSSVATLLAGLVLAACTPGDASSTSGSTESEGSQARAFTASANLANVPRDLLIAIAVVEGGLRIPADRPLLDVETDVPAAGPLQLRRGKLDTLARGASLVGASEFQLRRSADLALRAGALVLAETGAKRGAKQDDLSTWKDALEEMSGYADDARREDYAHRVFSVIARGGNITGRGGEILHLTPRPIAPSLLIDVSSKLHVLADGEFPGVEWIPTSCNGKCDPGRSDGPITSIVIHDTEGGWDASVATLQNDPGKSAHYIVGVDGRLGQFLTEDTTAWHAGNIHYNRRSVGVEHVGWADKPFPTSEYEASATLVSHLTAKYGILRDRAHVIGHDQIPNGKRIAIDSPPCDRSPAECQASADYGGASKHRDPGIWDWADYMAKLDGRAKCSDLTNRWRCSPDRMHAFRCTGELVEAASCSGACTSDIGAEGDLCTQTQASGPPPVVDGPPPAVPSPGAPPATIENDVEIEEGCTVARPRFGSQRPFPTSWVSISSVVGFATLARRRRPRRPRPRGP